MSLLRMLPSKASKINPVEISRIVFTVRHRFSSAKFHNEEEVPSAKPQNVAEDNKPITYSKSPANRWQAKFSRMGTDMDRLWYEPYVIFGSITVFMVYFCILREESDVDKEFERTLYNRIRGLEEKQLILALEYNREHDLDTKELEDRLKEIAESPR